MDKKKVKDYMTYDVVSVDYSGTAKDVIEKIQKTHHDGFPVVDGDVVVGYVSATGSPVYPAGYPGEGGDVR